MNRNANKTVKQPLPASAKLFRLAVIALIAVLAINTLIFVLKVGKTSYYNEATEYSDLKYYLDNEDYPNLARLASTNEAMNLKTVNDTSSFVYFADFYQAAFLYKAYKDAGESEKAEKALSAAKESLSLITDADFTDAINNVKAMYDIE